jgi:lipoprotein-anchoring transpeptidase ErfK/SrfK
VIEMRRLPPLLLALVLAVAASASPAHAAQPAPRPAASGSYITIDLSAQQLTERHNGRITAVIHVSTGGGYRYRSADGATHVAVTPVGRFTIYRKATGWQRGFLGAMYYPSYFTGGYAIHGSPSVPAGPVSHGCVRIPMGLAIAFYMRNPVGTPVIIQA